MAKIGQTKMNQAKKRAQLTAQALGEDFDEKLYAFYEEYSASHYEELLEKMVANQAKPTH